MGQGTKCEGLPGEECRNTISPERVAFIEKERREKDARKPMLCTPCQTKLEQFQSMPRPKVGNWTGFPRRRRKTVHVDFTKSR